MSVTTSHAPWVLAHAIEIDRHISFCGAMFRMSCERRHVVSAYLSAQTFSPREARSVGEFLLRADHRTILAGAYGDVPHGLRGALGRAGPAVHAERFYELLYRLLSGDSSAARRCIAHCNTLDLERLLVIDMLPDQLRSIKLVGALMNAKDARDTTTAFQLLVGRGVDEHWFAERLREVDSQRALSKTFVSAARRAHAPPHPVASCEFYTPIVSGEDLHRASREFNNCMRSYTSQFLDEAGHAFAIAARREERTIVHLVRKGGEWTLEGLFNRSNRRPSRKMREWAESYLIEHGVMVEVRDEPAPTKWNSLHNLIESEVVGFHFGL